jgi:hypothetical protein
MLWACKIIQTLLNEGFYVESESAIDNSYIISSPKKDLEKISQWNNQERANDFISLNTSGISFVGTSEYFAAAPSAQALCFTEVIQLKHLISCWRKMGNAILPKETTFKQVPRYCLDLSVLGPQTCKWGGNTR